MKHEPATVGRKLCKKCGEEKSVLAFAAASQCVDGLQSECRQCVSELHNKTSYRRRKESGKIKLRALMYRW